MVLRFVGVARQSTHEATSDPQPDMSSYSDLVL